MIFDDQIPKGTQALELEQNFFYRSERTQETISHCEFEGLEQTCTQKADCCSGDIRESHTPMILMNNWQREFAKFFDASVSMSWDSVSFLPKQDSQIQTHIFIGIRSCTNVGKGHDVQYHLSEVKIIH